MKWAYFKPKWGYLKIIIKKNKWGYYADYSLWSYANIKSRFFFLKNDCKSNQIEETNHWCSRHWRWWLEHVYHDLSDQDKTYSDKLWTSHEGCGGLVYNDGKNRQKDQKMSQVDSNIKEKN